MATGLGRGVLVLGGGPGAEREVSLQSAAGVADALRRHGGYPVHEETISVLTARELRELPGGVIFPVLHGPWGEGGPLQDLLEQDGRPFVGCRAEAARICMDKVATLHEAARIGVPTLRTCIFSAQDDRSPIPLPFVVKPVHEGSSVGLYICKTPADWEHAREAARRDLASGSGRSYMIEPFVTGRELTVAVIDGRAMPIIDIIPASGVYDYQAKYVRDDTRYVCDPVLPAGMKERICSHAESVTRAIGVRHLARADFMLDTTGELGHDAYLLEVNTMPGFTSHSLVPKSARHAGVEMPELCARLCEMAARDHAGSRRERHEV